MGKASVSKRRAKELRREARYRLGRVGSQLSAEAIEAAEEALRALDAAIGGQGGLAEAAGEVERLLEGELAPFGRGKIAEYVQSIGGAVMLALVLRAFVIEAFQIPTASMVPTLLIGDHLFVSKFAFGIRVPFTTRYVVRWGDVERGDIVVFVFPVEEVQTQMNIGIVTHHLERYARQNGGYPTSLDDVAAVASSERFDAWGAPFAYEPDGSAYRLVSSGADGIRGSADDLHESNSAFFGEVGDCLDRESLTVGKDYIKRVIGLSGDRVRMEDRVLYVNDVPIERTDERTFDAERQRIPMLSATETMDNGASYGVYNVGGTLGQVSFDEITVREDHVFVMGDNRDNSSDGRCWGQVPIANIKGTALFIFFSRDRRDGSVRWDRLFDAIR